MSWLLLAIVTLVAAPLAAAPPPPLAVARLGAALFNDVALSRDGTIACVTCHSPEHAFADAAAVSHGVGGALGTRNAPSLGSLRFMRTLFWDGRRDSLRALVFDPLL